MSLYLVPWVSVWFGVRSSRNWQAEWSCSTPSLEYVVDIVRIRLTHRKMAGFVFSVTNVVRITFMKFESCLQSLFCHKIVKYIVDRFLLDSHNRLWTCLSGTLTSWLSLNLLVIAAARKNITFSVALDSWLLFPPLLVGVWFKNTFPVRKVN